MKLVVLQRSYFSFPKAMGQSRLDVDLETYFLEFYHEIVNAEIAPDLISFNAYCLSEVKKAFHKKTFKAGNSNIHFDIPDMRCAYVFQYATLFSSTVAFHFMHLLRQNPVILDRLLAQETVVICCLGGGPATELLAIAKIIDQMMSLRPFGSQRLRKIHVDLIDIEWGWSITAENVVRNLNNSPTLQFDLNFIQADLAEPLPFEVWSALRTAHIVTAVKFMSAIYSMKGRFNTAQMLQRIVHSMPDGSLLFCLDSSVPDYFTVFRNSMTSVESMVEIYGPLQRSVHELSRFTANKSRRLFSKIYGRRRFAGSTKNYVSSWYKRAYQHAAFQAPAASATQWTTNWTTNPWNGTHFSYHALGPRVEECMLPSRWNSYNNYEWNLMSERDAIPPRKKRRYF